MIILYQILTILFTPIIFLYLKYRKLIGKEDKNRFYERLGYTKLSRPTGTIIWIHAASVGESISVIPLVHKLKARYPEKKILFTSGTKTSAEIVKTRLSCDDIIHQYVPVDSYFAVKRFLNKWCPNILLCIESELWPNIIFQTSKTSPVILLNARISDKSFKTWKKYKFFLNPLINSINLFFPQTLQDKKRLEELGARNTIYLGNLKYDSPPLPCSEREFNKLKNLFKNRLIWLAASTHKGEEEVIITAYKMLKPRFPDLLTIIVPRHPARAKEIETLINNEKLNLAIRTKETDVNENTDIYLADTIGELGIFYKLAKVSFIGGSFIPHGGQNPLEAARLNSAVIFGPYMDNFTEIAESLLSNKAACKVNNINELVYTLTKLFVDNELHTTYINNAKELAAKNNQIVDKIINEINKFLVD